MKKKQMPFSLQEHREFAQHLRADRDFAVHLLVGTSARYPAKGRLVRSAQRLLDAVGKLRSALDDELFRHHVEDATPALYYGPRSGEGAP